MQVRIYWISIISIIFNIYIYLQHKILDTDQVPMQTMGTDVIIQF
jgi:hypothetical protein